MTKHNNLGQTLESLKSFELQVKLVQTLEITAFESPSFSTYRFLNSGTTKASSSLSMKYRNERERTERLGVDELELSAL